MDLVAHEKLRSYMNLELCKDWRLAFDIALNKGYIDKEYFKKNMSFIEATNEHHPRWPNCLFFKDYLTRETLRIRYDR
tara:strand:+ start:39 stop:272 length:234 start_codon:yes stop_codon:yes gene_type:complete